MQKFKDLYVIDCQIDADTSREYYTVVRDKKPIIQHGKVLEFNNLNDAKKFVQSVSQKTKE